MDDQRHDWEKGRMHGYLREDGVGLNREPFAEVGLGLRNVSSPQRPDARCELTRGAMFAAEREMSRCQEGDQGGQGLVSNV